MTILYYLFSAVFLLVCVLMVMIVLLQPSQGEGLGSAFGGGISESFFGTRAMTWLARATIVLVLVYLGIAIGLNKIPRSGKSGDGSKMPDSEPMPAAAPAEAPADPVGETPKPAGEAPKPAGEAPNPAGEAPKPAPDKPPASDPQPESP